MNTVVASGAEEAIVSGGGREHIRLSVPTHDICMGAVRQRPLDPDQAVTAIPGRPAVRQIDLNAPSGLGVRPESRPVITSAAIDAVVAPRNGLFREVRARHPGVGHRRRFPAADQSRHFRRACRRPRPPRDGAADRPVPPLRRSLHSARNPLLRKDDRCRPGLAGESLPPRPTITSRPSVPRIRSLFAVPTFVAG